MTFESIRVLVAEDERPLRAAISDLVDGEPGMEIVGAAENAADAIELAAETEPDVALVDVRMPGGGPEAARGIADRSPETRVLALSAYDDRSTVIEMLRAGAVGYLVKGVPPPEIVEAIRRAMRGHASLPIDVISRVMDDLAAEIAERREAEATLSRSEATFRGLVESAPDALVMVDDAGAIALVNSRTEELFGYGRDELYGMPVEVLLPEEHREHHVAHRVGYLADPQTRPMGAGLELAGRRKDGTDFPVDVSLSSVETADGTLVTAEIRDMTERRRAEEVRRRSDLRFARLLEAAPEAVAIVDEEGRIVLVNQRTEELFGYAREELVGEPMEILLPERFRDRHTGHSASYFADPYTRPMGVEVELVGRRKDGTEFPADISLSALETEEGRLATAFIRDVTERRAAERARQKEDERFRALLEAAPDAAVIADAAGKIVLVNDQTERVFGYTRDELLGNGIEMLLPERLAEGHVVHRAVFLTDPVSRPMGAGLELAGLRKDGTEFPVDVSLSSVETDDGQLVIAFVRDITERRSSESERRQLAAIVESSDDAIIGKSLEGTIETWNSGAERTYGYSAREVVGHSISLLAPHDRTDELPKILERLGCGEEIGQLETRHVRKDGAEIDVSINVSAIRDARGTIIGASTIARDITRLKVQAELKRDHAERRALLAHLVAAGEEERTRIANDIHDDSIQVITAAGMRLQILRRSIEDPEQVALLDDLEETIQLSIARLRHLLFELRPPALDNDGLSAALEMYLDEAGDDHRETRYRLEDELLSQPAAQTRVILYRIAQEAVANARKHAQATTVEVSLQERDGGYLVRVADDGVGFVADKVSPTPGHLGLASMRERAVLAGGELRIDAAPGEGTTVEVWMPAVPSANGADPDDLADS